MHWTKMIERLKQFKREAPTLMGNEMVNHALDNLRSESFEGEAWQPRKPGAKRNEGRRLLMDTGQGERSIRKEVDDNTASITANEYMQAHNSGVRKTVRVKSHTRRSQRGTSQVAEHSMDMNTPARPFIKPSEVLNQRIVKVLLTRLKSLLT